ncbi:endonuclease/exonuclease/phosphatase family protein [Fulvimarina sp. 2208YS6-2-32]|uniref:Endonuclease/exonuclease/phosphatase family protein n=1 Tax=Fulvimarina uroteuthidis TaxID=3098149 RepID=A0ABU5I3Q8_9HYPH|nr:endonuclease/exonuclease/phosphatase family protein [Fulvimarina sp. 2208YS6-2-32]MDY8109993.1 endonuclease/exonuclease/phosphatase family protein [Fulvimarina sp. 2208YS6-2-32]
MNTIAPVQAAQGRKRSRPVLPGLGFGAIACLSALLLVAGFLGHYAAALDSFSHFRVHLGLAAIVAGLAATALCRRRARLVLGIVPLLVGIYAVFTVLPFLTDLGETIAHQGDGANASGDRGAAASAEEALTLLQMNLLYKAETAPALRTIRQASADFVTLQEASPRWIEALGATGDLYPHRATCANAQLSSSVLILSKHPFDGAVICRERLRFVAGTVVLENGHRVTIGSAHLFWPWPHGQRWQLHALSPELEALPSPLLVGGDFNAVPWSASVRKFAAASATSPVRHIGATFAPAFLPAAWKAWVGLPIDNVLVSEEILVQSAETLAPTAADHLPVQVRFAIADD